MLIAERHSSESQLWFINDISITRAPLVVKHQHFNSCYKSPYSFLDHGFILEAKPAQA